MDSLKITQSKIIIASRRVRAVKNVKLNLSPKRRRFKIFIYLFGENISCHVFYWPWKFMNMKTTHFTVGKVLSNLNIWNCFLTLFPKPNQKQCKWYIVVHMLTLYLMNFLSQFDQCFYEIGMYFTNVVNDYQESFINKSTNYTHQ